MFKFPNWGNKEAPKKQLEVISVETAVANASLQIDSELQQALLGIGYALSERGGDSLAATEAADAVESILQEYGFTIERIAVPPESLSASENWSAEEWRINTLHKLAVQYENALSNLTRASDSKEQSAA